MLFQEIYSCYYRAVAGILAEAVKGTLTKERIRKTVEERAFRESLLAIEPALLEGRWQLLTPSLKTPLLHEPSMPLTLLEKRWLKAVSLDPRVSLFDGDFSFLEGVEPLFTPEDYVVFDRYGDGDPYGEETYRQNFRRVLKAIQSGGWLKVEYAASNGHWSRFQCRPYQLEYSEKDDKFRVWTAGSRFGDCLRMSGIRTCFPMEKEVREEAKGELTRQEDRDFLILELQDERNALERVLFHFSHLEKRAERLSENTYRITLYYDRSDETEMVIRVLSFGPLVKVTGPEHGVELIRERLRLQREKGLR